MAQPAVLQSRSTERLHTAAGASLGTVEWTYFVSLAVSILLIRWTRLTHGEPGSRPSTFRSRRVSVAISGGVDDCYRSVSTKHLVDCLDCFSSHEVLSHKGNSLVADRTEGCDAGNGSEGHESEMSQHLVYSCSGSC